MDKNNGLNVLVSVMADTARSKNLLNSALLEIQAGLKAINVDMNPSQILKGLTNISTQVDLTTGKINKMFASLQTSSGTIKTFALDVEPVQSKKGQATSWSQASLTGMTETTSMVKETSKYFSILQSIHKKEREIASIKAKPFISDEDRVKLQKYNDELNTYNKQFNKSKNVLTSAGRLDNGGDISYKTEKKNEENLDKIRDMNAKAETKRNEEKSKQNNLIAKQYEDNEKNILKNNKILYNEQAKADSSYFNNTKESKKVQSLANTEAQKSVNISKDIMKNAQGNKELLSQLSPIREKYATMDAQALASSRSQYSVNKSMFKDMMSGWKDATARIINYTVIYRSLWAVIGAIKQGIQTIAELNKSFVDIQMVTGNSAAEVDVLANSYGKLAEKVGSTISQVAQGATEWLRQGKTVAETNELLKQSMIFSKVGAMSSAESTEYLTSTLNGYKMEVSDASKIVDVFSKLDMEAATSAKELAIAFQRSANSAHDAGIPFEQLAAYITTVSSATRKSASTIGESFKTLSARYMNVKLKIAVDPTSGENINDVEKALSTVGIKIRDSRNVWRDFGDVINEVGGNWANYNQMQKNTIVTAMAGVRQAENLRALFNNFGKAVEYTNDALDATGISSQKFGTYLDSIEAKTNTLITTFQAIAYQPVFVDLYKTVLNLGIGFGTVLNILLKFPPVLATMGIAMTAIGAKFALPSLIGLTSNLQELSKASFEVNRTTNLLKEGLMRGADVSKIYANDIANCTVADQYMLLARTKLTQTELAAMYVKYGQTIAGKGYNAEQAEEIALTIMNTRQKQAMTWADVGATISSWSLAGALEAVNGAMIALINNPVTWIVGLAAAVVIGIMVFDKFTITLEEQNQIVDDLVTSIKTLQTEYDTLSSQSVLNDEQKEKLQLLGNELKIKKDLLDVEEKIQAYKIVDKFNEKGNGDAAKGFRNSGTDFVGGGNTSSSETAVYDNIQKEIAEKEKQINSYEKGHDIKGAFKATEELAKLNEESLKEKQRLSDVYKEYQLSERKLGKNIPEAMSKTIEAIGKVVNATDEEKLVLSEGSDETATAVEQAESLSTSLTKLGDDVQTLHDIEKEHNKQNTLSSATMSKLMKDYPELTELLLKYQAGLATFAEVQKGLKDSYATDLEAYQKSALEKVQSDEDFYLRSKTKHKDLYNQFKIDYGIDISKFKTVAEAKFAIESALTGDLATMWAGYYDISRKTFTTGLSDMQKELQMMEAQPGGKDLSQTKALRIKIDTLISEGKRYRDATNDFNALFTSDLGTNVVAKEGSSATGTDKHKKEFEKKYADLQNLRDTSEISEAEYYNRLEILNAAYYAHITKYSEEYDKYESEVYKGREKLWKDNYDKKLAFSKKYMETHKDEWKNASTVEGDSEMSALLRIKASLETYYADAKKNHKTYLTDIKQDIDQTIADIEALAKSLVSNLKDTYGQSILDEVQAKIDKLENKKLNDKVITSLSKQIEKEQEKLKLLNAQDNAEKQKTDEIKKQKELIDSLLRQKDVRVYRADKGWTWEQDKAKVADAQTQLVTMESDLQKIQIQTVIDTLQAKLDSANKVYDDQIAALQKTLANETYLLNLSKDKTVPTLKDTITQLLGLGDAGKKTAEELLAWVNDLRTKMGLTAISGAEVGLTGGTATVGGGTNPNTTVKKHTVLETQNQNTFLNKLASGTGGNAAWAKAKLKSGNIFDRGGEANGIGLMAKDTINPERVLSPAQTKSFTELVRILPHIMPFSPTSISGSYKNDLSKGIDNSITIEHLTIQAPNGATLQSLLAEAKNIAKTNKR